MNIETYDFNNAYDSCNLPAYVASDDLGTSELASLSLDYFDYCDGDKDCYARGTDWTSVWGFNAAIMFLQAANFVVLAIGGFWWYPRVVGTILNFLCACCFHFTAIVMLFGGRLSPPGDLCSYNIVTSTYNSSDKEWDPDGYTYEDDANKMMGLAGCQLVFWIA